MKQEIIETFVGTTNTFVYGNEGVKDMQDVIYARL